MNHGPGLQDRQRYMRELAKQTLHYTLVSKLLDNPKKPMHPRDERQRVAAEVISRSLQLLLADLDATTGNHSFF